VIGLPIAERVAAAGFPLAVHDVRPEPVAALAAAGAQACRSAAEVAACSDLVISLVLDEKQTDAVLFGPDGAAPMLGNGRLLAIGSTLGPQPVQRYATSLLEAGCEILDMPMSGGYAAARTGALSLMIGANAGVLERALPVLRTFASVITPAGGVGAGQAAKLAHQLILSVNIMALLEGLALGAAAGVEPAVLRQILGAGLAGSSALCAWDEYGTRWKKMLESTPPGQTPPNLRKDLHGALALGQQLSVRLHLGAQASLIADAGIATGHDDPSL
jgi:3-hydroxyisobutyrate dehydrogenase-like beta-hydroxyacid dehydrogenase